MQSAPAKKTRLIALTAAILLAAPLAACSAQSPYDGTGGNHAPQSAPQGVALESKAVDLAGNSGEMLPNSLTSPDTSRSVISTGSIVIEVKDPRAALEDAAKVVKDLGGFVESQTVANSGTGSPNGASLSVRVPQAKFEDAFADLGELGKTIDESRSAADVTTQRVDLQARVESLETSVARLTELMAGSATTSELIEAESALAARQAELDSLKAQLEILVGQVDESTIWVTFTTASALPGGPSNFWEGLLAGLNSLTVAAAGGLVLLGILLPWLVIAAAVTLLIVLLVRGRRKRRAQRLASQAHITQPQAQQMQPQQQDLQAAQAQDVQSPQPQPSQVNGQEAGPTE